MNEIADVFSLSAMRKFVTSTLAAAMTIAVLPACSGGMANRPPDSSAAAAAPAASSATAAPAPVTAQAVAIPTPLSGVPDAAVSSIESLDVHPLDITPDGTKLLTVNTPNNDVEVFAISGNTLTFAGVIKVGTGPVSVRVYSNTQAWVVNKISNSVSIVDIKNNALIATLQTGAQPADVAFAGTAGSATNPARAYVSVAQAREVEVFDALVPGAQLQAIPILGQQRRAPAVGPNG